MSGYAVDISVEYSKSRSTSTQERHELTGRLVESVEIARVTLNPGCGEP